jgi:hypothetical protein
MSGLAAAQQERAITSSRRTRLNAELREIARDLSHAVDKRNAPRDRAALVKIYEGLALATEALSTIHAGGPARLRSDTGPLKASSSRTDLLHQTGSRLWHF